MGFFFFPYPAGPESYPAMHTEAPGLCRATPPKIQQGMAQFGVPHLPAGVVAQSPQIRLLLP